jgi:cytochrome b6-f complex iron-sulfur subunit
MLIAAIVVIGVLLLAALVLAMARRRDTREAIGVLSRETRSRDRSGDAIRPLEEEAPAVTGRDVERMAIERVSEGRAGTAVIVAPSRAPELAPPPPPVDLEALGVTRRQFLNRSILTVTGLSLASFGGACLAFLWSTESTGGFGGKLTVSKAAVDAVIATKAPFPNEIYQVYIQPYPPEDVPKAIASKAYADPIVAGMQQGYVALWHRCVHLGCRVPWCQTSQWFECPCHGSQYNRVGEKKGGPAPRGLDRFPLTVNTATQQITVDTSQVSQGPPIGTNTTGQEAEGPHCH